MATTDAERMIELMLYASQTKVAKALRVSKTTTGQWAKGLDVTPFRLRQVEDLLRPQQAGAESATADELLTEMRAIRRLLQRQARPAAPSAEQIASQVGRLLEPTLATMLAAEGRKPPRAAARRQKADRRPAGVR